MTQKEPPQPRACNLLAAPPVLRTENAQGVLSIMDDRTRILIALGSAAAANCVPCFEHFLKKALAVDLTLDEIHEAADIGDQVKRGAGTTIRSRINDIIGCTDQPFDPSVAASDRPCCG